MLKAKLAKLRRELLDPASGGGGGGGGRGDGFDVNKVGDARIGLVGAFRQTASLVSYLYQTLQAALCSGLSAEAHFDVRVCRLPISGQKHAAEQANGHIF